MFKNLVIFRLPTPWAMDLATLEEQLARGQYSPCSASEPECRGWIPPREHGPLVHAVNRQWLIALCIEKKILPAKVVNRITRERAKALEQQQGFAPGRKQMRELKDLVTTELLPKALSNCTTTRAWIDPVEGWLLVDASSLAAADAIVEHLRTCLDDFPLRPLHTERSPTAAMSEWLASGEAPSGFSIDRECELKAPDEEKSSVRYARHSLEMPEIKGHLSAGKYVSRLAMTWDDRLSFMLSEKFEVKKLAFLDVVLDQAEAAENAEEQFDADFALATGELTRFLPALVEALGGEVAEEE